METTTEYINANDKLAGYIGSEEWHKYLGGLVITDGVKALAEEFKCFWFLDIIASVYQQYRKHSMQVWKVVRTGDKAVVTCENGNKKVLYTQEISYTDLPANEATVWIEGDIALLPSEH